jgi:hypothetical protein
VPEPLDPETLFRALAEHHVDYVLIGGLAANLHGSPLVTNDADICPERTHDNLERLAAALRDLDARIRTHAELGGLAFTCDAEFLERMKTLNMQTRAGDFDISFEPGAFAGGYDELVGNAVSMTVFGLPIRIASLHDIIASKEAANRPKDQAALPYLYALEDEIAAIERERRA